MTPDPASSGVHPLVDTARLGGASDVVRAAHRVYEHLISLWAPGLIEAAHDLGVFIRLAAGPATAPELAAALGADERATRVMLDGLYAYDLLERLPDARYELPAPMRECLLPDGLFSLVGKIDYDRRLGWRAWRDLAGTVRVGTSDDDGAPRVNQIPDEMYESVVRGINFWAPPIVETLVAALADLGAPPSTALDVGSGSGIYSQLLLREFPGLTAVGLDKPRINALARRQSRRLGVDGRFRTVDGDFRTEDWGDGHDLVLFVNIFHLQSPDSAQALVLKAAKALSLDGLVAIVDQVVVDDDLGSSQDRFSRLFAASMLTSGGGDTYALREYDEWLAGGGLRRVRLLDAPMHRLLLAARA
ncbi:class I SAM-dependent methyltransferase, partial [Actinosynnema sp. NPDC023794]